MAKNKRLAAAEKEVDRTKTYPLADAIALVKSISKAKFDEDRRDVDEPRH